MKHHVFLILALMLPLTLSAQESLLSSGPMLGYNTMKEVLIWLQTTAAAEARIEYWTSEKSDSILRTDTYQTNKQEAYTARFYLETEPGVNYEYRLLINNVEIKRSYPLTFTSQEIWKWRGDAPDLKFSIGSCFYSNEPVYDRPGTPYGGSLEVLESLANEDPDFMVWLGDNIYLRETDWNSRTGIMHRYTHMRATPELQRLLATTHHYAIWDDHDYGPNDSDRSFWGKKTTEEAFRLFWTNPNYNVPGAGGITGSFIWADCQFFLMDNRYHRSSSKLDDRHVLGETQKQWLLDALLYSDSKFKFICIGAQFLNNYPTHDNHAEFPEERQEIIDFIDRHDIEGVVFLTGDRHYSEVTRLVTEGGTVIYDITCSSLTAGTEDGSKEKNDYRVSDTQVNANNYAVLSVSGSGMDRAISLIYKDIKGQPFNAPIVLDFNVQ